MRNPSPHLRHAPLVLSALALGLALAPTLGGTAQPAQPAAKPTPAAPTAVPTRPGAPAAPHATPPTTAPPGTTPAPGATPATPGAPAAPAASPTCPKGNLISRAMIRGNGLKGSRMRVRDGQLVTEGTTWNSGLAMTLTDAKSQLILDLRQPVDMSFMVLQGDNNDAYLIEGSVDGMQYSPVWTAPATEVGQGLRTRWAQLPKPARARFLRISGVGGDGYYSLSEVQAFCEAPPVWPPKLTLPPKKLGWAAIDNPMMVVIKGVLAGLGTILLLLMVFPWRRRPLGASWLRDVPLLAIFVGGFLAWWVKGYEWGTVVSGTALILFWLLRWLGGRQVFKNTALVSLAFAGLLGFASWWNLLHFHFDHYIHIWEQYHYFMGAKYGPELRYSRLYECTAAADMADGLRKRVEERKMRDLAVDNRLGTTEAIVRDPTRCTSHFSDERWQAFRKDIRFFRGRFSQDRWDSSQNDHGYNATPVWAIVARVLADQQDLSWERIEELGYIDSALLVLMWAFVLWAFGWQAACVALLYWGTNFPARFYWNGGSFLRYDWQFWMVVGLCFLRRERSFLGGVAMTYATLLRIFPGFLVAAVVLKALARMWRERRFVLSRAHWFFAAGCIATLAVLIPVSSWATNGIDAWAEFEHNSEKHLNTALTNNMGLKTVLGFDPATRAKLMRNDSMSDPFQEWKDARHHYYKLRQPIHLALIFLFCIILARAGDREEDWVAACLGSGLIIVAAELTCYYYGFLLTYGLLWERRKLPGIAAAALAGATCALSAIAWNDEHFAAMSLASVVVVYVVTAHVAFGKRPPADLGKGSPWKRKKKRPAQPAPAEPEPDAAPAAAS